MEKPGFAKRYNSLRYLGKRKELTYILGARCRNGVVLVGDRKVTLDDGTVVGYQEKIFHKFEWMVWGSAGIVGLANSFDTRLTNKLRHYAQFNREEFFISCEETFEEMARVSEEYRYNIRGGNLQVLMATRIGAPSTLHHLAYIGAPTPINEIKAVGSGEKYASIFWKKLWSRNMTMLQAANLAYLSIKYIEKEELDNSVGVGRIAPQDKPQVWFIPDNPPESQNAAIREATAKELDEMEEYANKRLGQMEANLLGLSELQ